MEGWEAPYMAALATVACSRGGRICEVGFGLGLSAKYIDAYATNPPRDVDGGEDEAGADDGGVPANSWVTEHVIIEANAEVAAAARRFAETRARVKTTVIEGFWQDVVETLGAGSFSGVLFDVFPLSSREVVDGESESFYPAAARLLEEGGIFSFYFDVADSWLATKRVFRGDVTRKLQAVGFATVEEDECLCEPTQFCEYFWKDRFLIPIATRGDAALGVPSGS